MSQILASEKKITVSVRMPESLRDKLEVVARDNDRSMNAQVLSMIKPMLAA